jgi:iron complex outermembrane recepter protein
MRRFWLHGCRSNKNANPTAWYALTFALMPCIGLTQQSGANDADSFRSDDVLEEIIVTAQYREQNLQETPLAITALQADTIAARGMVSVLEVADATPNVTMTLGATGFGNSNQTYIRGIGRDDSSFAFDPRTSIYVDDVYHATLFGSVFNLLDIERIEVLRGPQGTLFGRNTIGGAVRIFTKKPRGDGSGYLEATAGSFNRLDLKGAVDLSLVPDSLFLRLAAGRQERDGFVTRLNFACVNPSLAGNLPAEGLDNGCRVGTLGGVDLYNVRAALSWIISDRAESTLTAEYLNDDLEPPADVVRALSPSIQDPSVPPGVSNGLGLWLQQIGVPAYGLSADQSLLDALQPAGTYTSYAIFGNPGLDDPLREMENTPLNTLESWSIANVFDWQFGATIDLKSITAFREYDGVAGASYMALPLVETHTRSRQQQFSQELRLSGSGIDQRLDWTLGVFCLDVRNRFDGRVNIQGFGVFIPGPNISIRAPLDFLSDDRMTVDNKSVFAHAIWHATDRLNFTAGARYTDETKGYKYFRQDIGQPPNLDTSAPDTEVYELNTRLALDYSWRSGLLAYMSHSTGFTAGGFDPRPFTPADAELSFGTETAGAWEVGLKSEWLERRLRINTAFFRTTFDDIQLQVGGCAVGCRTTSPIYYDNGGDAEVRGFEVEVDAVPVSALLITAYVGRTDFDWVRFSSTIPIGVTLDSPQYKSPEWNAGLSVQCDFDLGRGGMLTPRIDTSYRSTTYFGADRTSPELRQDGFALVNARLAWQPVGEHWAAAVALTNLTDEVHYYNLNDSRSAFGYAVGHVARPREWSATVTYRF